MAIPTNEVYIDSTILPDFIPDSWDIFWVVKIALIVFLSVYMILAFMVIKQVKVMTKTIKSGGNGFMLFLAYLHLFIVIITLLFTIFFL